MPPIVTIAVEDEWLQAGLRRLTGALRDTTPTMRGLAEIMVDASARAFLNKKDPTTGASWKPLAPSTIQHRLRHGRSPDTILQFNGTLASSVTGETGTGHAVREIRNTYAFIGTNLVYAATHQFGAIIERKGKTATFKITIPARPFLGVSDTDKQEMVNLVLRHLKKAFVGS